MDYENFNFTDESYLILMQTDKYQTTAGGNWSRKNVEVKREVVDADFYSRYIRSIPFFNNFGDGASCRAKYSYECAGYLPTTITSISPFKMDKHVVTFTFLNANRLRENAGYREKEIMDHAVAWEPFETNKPGRFYTLIAGDGSSAMFDDCGNWRG